MAYPVIDAPYGFKALMNLMAYRMQEQQDSSRLPEAMRQTCFTGI